MTQEEPLIGIKTIVDFKRRRSGFAVFGFYVFYLLVGFIVVGIAESFFATLVSFEPGPKGLVAVPPGGEPAGDNYGAFVVLFPVLSAVYCSVIHLVILLKKGALRNPARLPIIAVTVVLSLIGSVVLGLILPVMQLNSRSEPESKPV